MAEHRRTIVLMGLRGSGKSTIGRALAARLGCPFEDMDDLTCARLGGGTVAEIWATEGEGAFREAEGAALGAALERARSTLSVIALGGGSPTAPSAADRLRDAADTGLIHLVYLRATPETLRLRLGATDIATRPSLTGAGTLDEIERVFNARDRLYEELASTVLSTDGLTMDQVSAKVGALNS